MLTDCDGLVGSSTQHLELCNRIRIAAGSAAPVLIRGERGAGKELVARAIHGQSMRAAGPFLAVPCGVIPDAVFEREVLGARQRSSATGAGAATGLLAAEAGGTLFLDGVAELSPPTQLTLLRVLFLEQPDNVPPLRVLSSTCFDVRPLVGAGLFSKELFAFLSEITIEVPALRHRAADIAVFANHFVSRYAFVFQKPVQGLSPTAIRRLCDHDWPGNIRELEGVIQASMLLASGDIIRAEDLPRLPTLQATSGV